MQTITLIKCTDGSYDFYKGENYIGEKKVWQTLKTNVENATVNILDYADAYRKEMLVRRIMKENGLG